MTAIRPNIKDNLPLANKREKDTLFNTPTLRQTENAQVCLRVARKETMNESRYH